MSEMRPDMGVKDIQIMNLDEINIEKITGFAGARFNDCINKDNDRKSAKDTLHKLFDSDAGEMFEGSESFTWISEED